MINRLLAALTAASTFALLFATPMIGRAAVPPPPVNQTLGIGDGVFNDLVEADCRVCHNPTPPPGVPVDTSNTNVDRHHLRVGTAVPDPTAAPNPGVGAGIFECLTCHTLQPNPDTGNLEFAVFRDCLECHTQISGQASVHHLTPTAQAGSCAPCHGSLVQDMNDGHTIPTYAPSLVTPWPSGKPNAGPAGEGSCLFCHNNNRPPLPDGSPDKNPTVDPASGVPVYRNAETHHNTGFILQANRCIWCHNILPGLNDAFSIRTCEGCHGIESLHSIQVDSDNPANPGIVIPGAENPWFGHIGNQSDCFGCHGFSAAMSASAPGTGAIIPDLYSLSVTTMHEGGSTDIIINGNNFINQAVDPVSGEKTEFKATVLVTDTHGYSRTLQPLRLSNRTIEVAIPADLPSGPYRVTALKGRQSSKPVVIAVIPKTEIDRVKAEANGSFIIKGTGLGTAPPEAANLGVFVDGIAAEVNFWSDSEIRATSPEGASGQAVTVISGFGSISAPIEKVNTIRKPKGKKDPKKSATASGRLTHEKSKHGKPR